MSSILDRLEETLLSRRTVRVAVCGAGNCGKTVFLTSLLNHLLCRDPDFAPEGWRVVRADLDAATGPFPPFPLLRVHGHHAAAHLRSHDYGAAAE